MISTARVLAAGCNDIVSTRLLVDARVDLKARAKNGLTALGYAVSNGNLEAAAVLRKAGAHELLRGGKRCVFEIKAKDGIIDL